MQLQLLHMVIIKLHFFLLMTGIVILVSSMKKNSKNVYSTESKYPDPTNPEIPDWTNPEIPDLTNPKIPNPTNPKIPDPTNPEISEPTNHEILDPKNPKTSDSDATILYVCNKEERTFIDQTNRIRKLNGLEAIPTSPSLCKVGREHVLQLSRKPHIAQGRCNLHSWDDCCYTSDHQNPNCMWLKPKKIAGFDAYGYENAANGYATSADALNDFLKSQGHRDVILNNGQFANKVWKAIGAGIKDRYYVLWFADEVDVATVEK